LLIDTQGLFDGKSTRKQNGNIFTLSTLISSIQIFNLSQKMQEDNLENLQVQSFLIIKMLILKTLSNHYYFLNKDFCRIWTSGSY